MKSPKHPEILHLVNSASSFKIQNYSIQLPQNKNHFIKNDLWKSLPSFSDPLTEFRAEKRFSRDLLPPFFSEFDGCPVHRPWRSVLHVVSRCLWLWILYIRWSAVPHPYQNEVYSQYMNLPLGPQRKSIKHVRFREGIPPNLPPNNSLHRPPRFFQTQATSFWRCKPLPRAVGYGIVGRGSSCVSRFASSRVGHWSVQGSPGAVSSAVTASDHLKRESRFGAKHGLEVGFQAVLGASNNRIQYNTEGLKYYVATAQGQKWWQKN